MAALPVHPDPPWVGSERQCTDALAPTQDGQGDCPSWGATMALFPCDVGSHRFTGRANTLYVGVANGSFSERSRIRACNKHSSSLVDFWRTNCQLVAVGESTLIEDGEEPSSCTWCHKEPHPWQVFVNTYIQGEDTKQYWGASCEECLPLVRQWAHLGP